MAGSRVKEKLAALACGTRPRCGIPAQISDRKKPHATLANVDPIASMEASFVITRTAVFRNCRFLRRRSCRERSLGNIRRVQVITVAHHGGRAEITKVQDLGKWTNPAEPAGRFIAAIGRAISELIYLDTYMLIRYIKRVESVFEIIAEPNRRAILSLLVSSQQSVGEIERQLRMPQPTVSKHLRVLREAGFVESTVDAQRRLYRLKPEPLQEMDAWLAQFRRFWSAHVDALERHLDRMDQLNTNEKEEQRETTRPKPRT